MHDNLGQKLILWISILITIASATFWTYSNFLTAEDSVILYNRVNHLKGSPIFFYYAGYVSAFPQFSAYILSAMAPIWQAIFYSITSTLVFCALLAELFLATGKAWPSLSLTTMCVLFYPEGIYNLSSSFWAGLGVLGLIGLNLEESNFRLSWVKTAICLPGIAGSPLGVVFLPLYILILYRKPSGSVFVINFLIILSYIFLTDHQHKRSNIIDLISNFFSHLLSSIDKPSNYLINSSSISDFFFSAVGIISIFFSGYVAVNNLWNRDERHFIAPYLLGSICTVLIALAASNIPLQARYWFPVIVAGLVAFDEMKGDFMSKKRQETFEKIFVVLLTALSLSILGIRLWASECCTRSTAEWRALAEANLRNTVIIRHQHKDGEQWAIGVGVYPIHYSECEDFEYHPRNMTQFGFSIYCGGKK